VEIAPLLTLPAAHKKVEQAAIHLGDALREEPRYQRLLHAIFDLQEDAEVRHLALAMEAARREVYGGAGSQQKLEEFHQLEAALEALPSILAYHRAEEQVRALCREVNRGLEERLGIPFAANVQRGCGC